jgi:hypothetical protein
MKRNHRRWDDIRLCLGMSVVLYVGACATPAISVRFPNFVDMRGPDDPCLGWLALLVGWVSFAWGLSGLPWLANPAWLAGVICLLRRKNRGALICGIAATLFGLSTLFFSYERPNPGVPGEPHGPLGGRLHDKLIGWYLWQSSLIALTVAAGLGLQAARSAGGESKLTESPTTDDFPGLDDGEAGMP